MHFNSSANCTDRGGLNAKKTISIIKYLCCVLEHWFHVNIHIHQKNNCKCIWKSLRLISEQEDLLFVFCVFVSCTTIFNKGSMNFVGSILHKITCNKLQNVKSDEIISYIDE